MALCEGCGERVERCRCNGPAWDEDLAFGFHILEPEDEEDDLGEA